MCTVQNAFAAHREVFTRLIEQKDEITLLGQWWIDTLQSGGTIFFCGNGGSAADSQHLAAELVGRYHNERQGLRGIALTVDTSVLTAVANDYSYDCIFSRQVEALGRPGDLLVAISTSGNSPNIVKAAEAATQRKMRIIGLTGAASCKLDYCATSVLHVPSDITAHIQEMHLMIGHIWCAMVDEYYER